MTYTFNTEREVIIFALERIISYAKEYNYYFVANSTWWIASIKGLDKELRNYIDVLERVNSNQSRAISATPRDIARSISPEPQRNRVEYTARNTRTGRINPLRSTKRQLKKAARALKKNTK
jgi:hypothetical protein